LSEEAVVVAVSDPKNQIESTPPADINIAEKTHNNNSNNNVSTSKNGLINIENQINSNKIIRVNFPVTNTLLIN
jgi:hypothetical protein